MTIPEIRCPRCRGKGGVPYPKVPSKRACTTRCTTRCSLCWGIGNLPAIEAVVEGKNKVALHYWLCNCQEMQDRIHPSNHDVCLICDLTEEDASPALAEDVRAFFQNDYGLRLELFNVT